MQYFADRDIFCAGRVAEEDLHRVAAAAGGTVQTTVNNVIDDVFSCLFPLIFENLFHIFIILKFYKQIVDFSLLTPGFSSLII